MIYEKIKGLCAINETTIKRLEKELNIANGSVASWKKSSPKSETLKKVADYFNISVDYLLGGSDAQDRREPAFLEDALLSPSKEDLKAEKNRLVELWGKLYRGNQIRLLGYLEGLLDSQPK